MARKTLGDLINAALSDADSGLKLASARDVSPADPGDYLAEELKLAAEDSFSDKERAGTEKVVRAHEKKMHEKDDEKDDEKGEKKSSRADVLDAASYGMKLAEALEVGASVIFKMAAEGASPRTAPGPQIMESQFIGAQTVSPKAHSNVSDKITGPTLSNSDLPTSKADHTGNLDGQQPHNNTGKTAGWTRSKEASARALRAMQKQAEVLMRMGQTKAAQQLLEQAEKRAQDPSSPQPEGLPAHSDSFRMSTEPGESSHIPDNAGFISMTKAQAKDRSVQAATQHISETPKRDNAVPAHTLRTDGQKISASLSEVLEAARTKGVSALRAMAAAAKAPHSASTAAHAAPAARSAASHAAPAAAARTGGPYGKGEIAVGGSKPDSVRIIRPGDPGGPYGKGEIKVSQTDLALQRTYLERALKVASDPEANPRERAKAASVVSIIRSKMTPATPSLS